MFSAKRKDPVCGMREVEGEGIEKNGKWFCSENCLKEYERVDKRNQKTNACCCH